MFDSVPLVGGTKVSLVVQGSVGNVTSVELVQRRLTISCSPKMMVDTRLAGNGQHNNNARAIHLYLITTVSIDISSKIEVFFLETAFSLSHWPVTECASSYTEDSP